MVETEKRWQQSYADLMRYVIMLHRIRDGYLTMVDLFRAVISNHVRSYDFVSARTHDGRSVRLLSLIDEHTRESLLVPLVHRQGHLCTG